MMNILSFIFCIATASVSFAASPEAAKLSQYIENEQLTEFKKVKTQLNSQDLESLIEKALASSNPGFLKHIIAFQKQSLSILKNKHDLTEIAITESTLDLLKELDRSVPLDSIVLSDGRNLLHAASSAGTVEQIEFILKKYPKMISHLDKEGENPLSAAARRGELKTIEALFKGQIKPVSVKNKKGLTAVEIAKSETFEKSAALIDKLLKQKK